MYIYNALYVPKFDPWTLMDFYIVKKNLWLYSELENSLMKINAKEVVELHGHWSKIPLDDFFITSEVEI